MSSTVGDYLFWRLSGIGVRNVIGRGPSSLFLGSIQRNHLNHIDSTRTSPSPSGNEVGAFVASSAAGDLSACYEEGRRLFAWRPVIIVSELESAQFTSVGNVTANLHFAAAIIINSPVTAASQINRVLDVMLYESKPVFIGLSLAVAGQIMSLPQTVPSTSGGNASGQYASCADAAVAMSFIR
ncbi:hypothetical protein K458DRAFT_409304 [Lentithecium fluviatile CBS 122367]|uniref:Uncharacterized protein n=1 Tax=Lentithecium fluviatile CBS 122367 TaxID=1168545 RepID=A0A6G1IIC8_9PLEO|nr:hypothetical protein K458DRAFT_409304 [Lentithecium fluviatile CBS 122367]